MTFNQVMGIKAEVKRLDKLRSIYFLESKLDSLESELETWSHELLRLEEQYRFMCGKDSTKVIKAFVECEILPMDDIIESIESQVEMINSQLRLLGGVK